MRVLLSVHSFCDCSRDVAVATNFVVKFAKLADLTLIQHTSVLKWIGRSHSQFRFHKIKCQLFFHIVQKFAKIQSGNAGVYEVRMCTAGVDHYSG